ncbi:MAG TPA: ABC transporter permease, partial [Dehalococcoidia bacterium]|nr:ABC transporter permease [Dehalococcoidia bacterium]
DPWLVQYLQWIGGVLHGDLGKSLWSDKDVSTVIWDHVPVTLELAIMTFILANIIAITFGMLSALRQDSILDYILRLTSIGGLSIPSFWIATLVIVLGARWFNYLPPLQYIPFTDDPIGNLGQFIVPSSIIAIASTATIMRMVRSSMLEVMRQDYVRTAWAKGLRERTIIYRHALKNAFLPVVTLMGLQLNFLLGGSLVIEIIFGLPGLGRLSYDAIQQRDYTVIQGIALVFGGIFVLINLGVDMIYAWLDPRIKY